MKARIEKSIALLMSLHFLTAATIACSEESKWLFSSIYGQSLWISYEPDESLYALTFGDVTEKVASCDSGSMKICFRSSVVDIAVPEKEPKVGEGWEIAGTTFSLVSVIENLELLDETFRDVLVIAVNRNLEFPSGHPGTRRFVLFYSYNDGLIAFQEGSDPGNGLFIASKLPSI